MHLREEGLQKLDDKSIFKKVIKEDRIVLTFDLDFGEISAQTSIILFRLRNTRTPFVITRMEVNYRKLGKSWMRG